MQCGSRTTQRTFPRQRLSDLQSLDELTEKNAEALWLDVAELRAREIDEGTAASNSRRAGKTGSSSAEVNYRLHPDAALEYEEQIAYYMVIL